MNKRDQVPSLYYVVRAYNAAGEIIKSVPCYGVTKEAAAKEMGQAVQHLVACKGVAEVREFWAGEDRL